MSLSMQNHEDRIRALEERVIELDKAKGSITFPNYKDRVSVPFRSNWTAPYDCFITGCMGLFNSGEGPIGKILVDGVELWSTYGSNNGDYAGETTFYIPVKKGSVVYIQHGYQTWAHRNQAYAFRYQVQSNSPSGGGVSNAEFIKSGSGYYRDPNSGLMILWEKISGQGRKKFNREFPNACLAIFISPDWARRAGGEDNAGCGANIVDRTQYDVYIDGGASNNNYILAIGYLVSNSIRFITKIAYLTTTLLTTLKSLTKLKEVN